MFIEQYELPEPPDRRDARKISKAISQLGEGFIKHDIAQGLLDQIEDMHLTLRRAKRCVGMLIYGNSGVGKSFLVEAYASQFPRQEEAERTRIPVLYVKTPGQPTAKALAEETLIQLGDPFSHKGSAEEKMKRVLKLMKECGVELIILDDIQHVCENLKQHDRNITADTIKNWMDVTGIPFLFAGTPSSRTFFVEYQQLGRRVSPKLEMPAFRLDTEEDGKAFLSLLKALNDRLPFGPKSALVDEFNPERFFKACDGLIGYLVRLIEEATAISIRSKSKTLTTAAFEEAFPIAVYPKAPPSRNPFNKAFDGERLWAAGEPFEGLQ